MRTNFSADHLVNHRLHNRDEPTEFVNIASVPLELSTPVKYIKRVGERVAEELSKRGVETVEDLLYHLPFRYEDRLSPKPIAEMQPGEMASRIEDMRGSALLTARATTRCSR